MSKGIENLSNGIIMTVIDERKEEFRALKPSLPNGWTVLYIDKFHSELKGKDAVKKYKRIQNISDGAVAANEEEFKNIKSLIIT
jgi:hypothetical protein